MTKKLLFILCLVYCYVLNGQHPIYTQFTEKDGLPDIEFYNIIEDSKGFIWLAADKGFYRYDGNKFKSYTNKDKRGLSVFEPVEGAKGRVWCCNISGQFFYVENDELITFIDVSKEINWQLGSFLVTETHLIIFTAQYVYKIALDTKKIEKRVKISNYLSGYPLRIVDEIYVTTGESIIALDLDLNIVKKLTSESVYNDLYIKAIGRSMIFGYKKKTYLKFTDQNNQSHVYLFDINSGQYREIALEEELKKSHIITISFHHDEMLLSTLSGLWVYTLNHEKITFKNRYFKDAAVSKLIVDRNENYWLTTLRNGVFVIPNINNVFYRFPEGVTDFETLEKIDDETFFYGTTNGKAGFYNFRTHAHTPITLNSNVKISAALYDDNQQLLYISTQTTSYIYDLKTKTLTKGFPFENARSISYIGEDDFFFTNYKGAIRIKHGKGFNYHPGIRAYTGFHDTVSQNSYVSYVNEFIKYDKDFNPTIIRYNGKQIHATKIAKTDNGIVWVATSKDGVYGIKNDRVVKNFTTKNGLASNLVQTLTGDGNLLWLVTNKGIQLLDTEIEKFQTITKGDGVSTYFVSSMLAFDNHVVFATNQGVFSIQKETAFQQKAKPEIYFTGIQINEKDTLVQQSYTLPHYQNAIKLSFNSNGFRSKEHIRYYSRLVGFNDDWIPVGEGIDFVKYNSLPVGNYTFQVKAVSTSLAGTSDIEAVQIAIKNPFWKQAWFIFCCILSSLLLIVLYYRSVLKKRDRQKNKELEKLAQERELVFLKLENLRSQMNPHFIFNALNSIQEYIILNKKNLASDYLGKFADLIRTYLNHSNRGAISLQDEIDCLKMYLELEELRFEDKLNYTFQIDPKLDPETVSIPTMLIQPYVENALKHGLLHKKDKRELVVTFKTSTKSNTIICMVEDNGVGRQKAMEIKQKKDKLHKSFGTQATQDRLDLLNYGKEKQIGVSIEDLHNSNTNEPCGTKVVITIPIKKI